MKVCLNDCPVHTYLERETGTYCPACERPGSIVPCPDCLGTGLRMTPGRDKTLVCTGCDYRIDLDEESPAFLGWVEKMTEQSNLSEWGQPPPNHLRFGWSSAPEGSIQWHLDAAREQILYANAHDLEEFDENDDLFLSLFFRSLSDAPVNAEW